MEFWFSGEDQADVGELARIACNEIEDELNRMVKNHNYGGLDVWGIISIILDNEFTAVTGYDEIKKYWKTKKELEFRLKVDHGEFKSADELDKRRLIFAMVLRSIDEARKLKVPDFDFDQLEADVRSVGRKNCWCD